MTIFLKLLSWKLQFIPRNLALLFGRCLGSFIYYFFPLRKSYAIKNLETAFPDWTIEQRKALLKDCYRHYGMVFVDFFRLPKVKREKDTRIVTIPPDSIELFKKYPGGIILSGHMGNWEYIGPSLGIHEIKCAGVTRVQRNNKSDSFFNELRSSENVRTVPFDSGSKNMVKIIQEGNYLGLISDQNAGGRGSKAIFFNESVSVPKGAAVFHLKTNTPILLGFCILSPNFSYHLSFQELDVEGLPENSEEAIVEINQRFTNLLEDIVRKYPEQYFWFHRKWSRDMYKGLSRF